MAPNSLQSQRQQLSLHHQPCGEVTSPLRHDDNKAMAAAALLRDETRQVSAPLYWQNPKDDAHQRPIPTTVVVGASPSVLPTNNYTVINSEECAADSNKSIKFKKRPIPPCPCPDDMTAYVKMNRKEGVNNRRRSEFNIDDDNLDVKDMKGYCRSIRSKLNEVFYRTPGPLQQNLRARLLAQQVWFELQCKLFLPTPVITKSTFIEVLQTFENIRDYSATKERSIWKQDMTATVGQGTGPPFSVFWGHAPRPRLCACPDTPCRCARTRAMPQDFSLPRGESNLCHKLIKSLLRIHEVRLLNMYIMEISASS
ncbi:uncharacterized protein LOC113226186 isoform X1 [Hyposmocoma kahamanoa]|uniref:uncharacterized protein LOC113226186 isoform X1 n=1 Tax=Hyposmocoma kahamanoa TaxID=1477025 RepID=UPI000E6D5BC8|nr:uncharacterized protein LOC113226186 isoform X1 [Hyposmocoma kahamanoa]